MASFEKFFIDWLSSELGRAVGFVMIEDSVSATLEDRTEITPWHEELSFSVDCFFDAKGQADAALSAAHAAIKKLPAQHPVVLSARLSAESIESAGTPRVWIYSGIFTLRVHTQEEY